MRIGPTTSIARVIEDGYLGSILVLFCVCVFVSFGLTCGADVEDGIGDGRGPRGVYVEHDPIEILNSAGAVALATSEGWAGNGSEANPFIISGYEFSGIGYDGNHLLTIQGPRYSFVVRDCYFHDLDPPGTNFHYYSALKIGSNVRARVTGNEFEDINVSGVYVYDCPFAGIDNNSFIDNRFGVSQDSSITHTLIEDNVFLSATNGRGININYGTTLIRNNVFTGPLDDMATIAIRCTDMEECQIVGNNFKGYSTSIAHRFSQDYWKYRSNCEIRNNEVLETHTGLSISDTDDVVVSDNVINASESGIRLSEVYRSTFTSNVLLNAGFTCYQTFGTGHSLDPTNTVRGLPVSLLENQQNIHEVTGYGQMIFLNCSQVSWTGLRFDPGLFGFIFERCEDINLSDCSFEGEGPMALQAIDISGLMLSGNAGVPHMSTEVQGSNVVIRNNSFVGGSIDMAYLDVMLFEDNSLTGYYGTGLAMRSVSGMVLRNTFSIEGSEYHRNGLSLSSSKGVTILGNSFTGDGMIVSMDDLAYRRIETDDSNKINGLPIVFRGNIMKPVLPEEFGQLFMWNCSDVDLISLDIHDARNPINLLNCSDTVIRKGRFRDITGYVVTAYDCTNLSLVGNSVSDSRVGFDLRHCVNLTVSQNHLFNLSDSGSSMYSCSAITISRNVVSDTEGGLYLWNCQDFEIYMNRVQKVNYSAIILSSCYDGVIHRNSFVDNMQGAAADGPLVAQCYQIGGECRWDVGGLGNYWSDLPTRYPYASPKGTTWNVSYVMDGTGMDEHPLVDDPVLAGGLTIASGSLVIDQGDTLELRANADLVMGVQEWLWKFTYDGNVVILQGYGVPYTFEIPGRYTINVTLSDSLGRSVTVDIRLKVTDIIPPTANHGGPYRGYMEQPIELNGTGSTDNVGVDEWRWTVYDANRTYTVKGSTNRVFFDEPGYYQVHLNVTDADGNHHSVGTFVTVLDDIPPDARAGGDLTVRPGETVRLDASGSRDNIGIVAYDWNFTYLGEEVRHTGVVLEYTFEEAGTYEVTLQVFDDDGNMGEDTVQVRVLDVHAPIALVWFEERPMKADAGDEVWFDGSNSTDNVGIVEWTWTFEYKGKTIVLEGPQTIYTFNEPGKYRVEFKVEDAAGHSSTETFKVNVRDPDAIEGPGPLFIALMVTLVVAAVGSIVVVVWYRRRKGGGDTVEWF